MRLIIAAVTVAAVFATSDSETLTNVNSFDSVDTDGDGSIDFNEFEKWHKTTLNERNNEKIKKTFAKFDTSRDQKLDVAEFVPLAYEYSQKPVDTVEQIFRRLDTNGDNIVDTNEAAIARKEFDAGIIDGVLAVADVNNDGQLTYEEFTAQLSNNRPKSTKEANKEMAYQVLNYIDVNQDGKLSSQEIYTFASVYNKLSKAEIAHVIESLDANKDGFLTVGELERIPGKIAQLANVQPPPSV